MGKKEEYEQGVKDGQRGGFFDDFFVEGALVVLGSYFVKPNSGFGELAQPDLVEN